LYGSGQLIVTLLPEVVVVGVSGASGTYAQSTTNSEDKALNPKMVLDCTLNEYVTPGVKVSIVKLVVVI
jgi:hypothetical protein